MSAEHDVTELRCEILDLEENMERHRESFRTMIVKIDERIMRYLEAAPKHTRIRIPDQEYFL